MTHTMYVVCEGEATRLAELALIFIPIYNVALSDTYIYIHDTHDMSCMYVVETDPEIRRGVDDYNYLILTLLWLETVPQLAPRTMARFIFSPRPLRQLKVFAFITMLFGSMTSIPLSCAVLILLPALLLAAA